MWTALQHEKAKKKTSARTRGGSQQLDSTRKLWQKGQPLRTSKMTSQAKIEERG